MSDVKMDKIKSLVAEFVDHDSECGRDFAYCFDLIESQQKEITRLQAVVKATKEYSGTHDGLVAWLESTTGYTD